MISSRFAAAACVLIALALGPTLIHSYGGVVVEDGRKASALPETLAGFSSRPSNRAATWGQRRFESHDWVERLYSTPKDVTLTVIRSYDLKALYHHPELAVAYGSGFESARVVFPPDRPDLPIHVLQTERETGPAGFYVLLYDDRFVSDPISFQIRTAAELLFTGRQAMTLFFVLDPSVSKTAEVVKEPSVTLLRAAIDRFVAPPTP